jgi:hypothetical protein
VWRRGTRAERAEKERARAAEAEAAQRRAERDQREYDQAQQQLRWMAAHPRGSEPRYPGYLPEGWHADPLGNGRFMIVPEDLRGSFVVSRPD